MDRPTLLMDIGNVLLRVEISRMAEALAAGGTLPSATRMKHLLALAEQHERGILHTDAFLDQAAAVLGSGHNLRSAVLNAWNNIFLPEAPIASTWQACRDQKQRGTRIVLFSNTNETHIAFMKEHWPELFDLADGAVYSCAIGAMKPEAAFYERAISRLGLIPEHTWYFDDKPENVEAGRHHGLRAHVFDWRSPEQMLLPFLPGSGK